MSDKKIKNWYIELPELCKNGDYENAKIALARMFQDINYCFAMACMSGNMQLVNLFVLIGADDWNHGCYRACQKGHVEIVKQMLEKGANDFDKFVFGAMDGYHYNIIKLISEKDINCLSQLLIEDIIKLLELGLNIKKLYNNKFYGELNTKILQHKTHTFNILKSYLRNENLKLINDYQLF